jgi:hypothetical protein
MSETKVWYSGVDNYRKHTLEFNDTGNIFTLELLDVESRNLTTVQDSFKVHLEGANLPIEVLYSGGLDSGAVILSCLQLNIPVIALTMKMTIRGQTVNIEDLYYAEKFCREHGVEHKIVELDIEKFFNNGDHISYTDNYQTTLVMVATKLWLIEQANSFPVLGGDYTWPQTNINQKLYSPHRNEHNCYDGYMQDKSITGIGNMISHSIDSNVLFIKQHLRTYSFNFGKKHMMFSMLGFGDLAKRKRSDGWDTISQYYNFLNIRAITQDLIDRYGKTKNILIWNDRLAELIDSDAKINDSFV